MQIKISTFRVLFLTLIIHCSALCTGVLAQEAAPETGNKILLIHSYHEEYPWVASITTGVRKALDGQNIALKIFYMDTKRNNADAWKIKAGEQARKMIAEWKPDAVIAADDDAQRFVTRQYVNKKPWFIFCGVNGDPADYNLPASNITGIIERPFFTESLSYLKHILRYSSRTVNKAVVISDLGATSVGALSYMRSEAQDTDFKILGYYLIGDFPGWQKRIAEYNADETAICIYTYHTTRGPGTAASMDPQQVLQWTAANCIVPTVGFLDFAIEGGLLCGVVESGEEHGYEAARMALDLLRGKNISSLPVKRASRGLKMINLQAAEKLGISVPEDVIKSADRIFR
jgi:ABC-type uncharacterized transport system substrate-binding protein